MGFLAGLTGGITLTLGATYLAVAAHERNRQAQADVLRAQALVLHGLATPSSPYSDASSRAAADALLPRPTRRELAAQERAHFVESAKDRWNAEIEGAVRWAQNKDWTAAVETAEDAAARLLGLERSAAAADSTSGNTTTRDVVGAAAARQAREDAQAAAAGIRSRVDGAKAWAGEAADGAKARAGEVAHAVREESRAVAGEIKTRAASARAQAVETAHAVQEEASAARGVVGKTIERGIEKGRQMIGRAQAAVLLAEERAEAKVDAKLMHLSDVEKALAERYEKKDPDAIMGQSVDELLRARYTPIDKRDNTRLRGI